MAADTSSAPCRDPPRSVVFGILAEAGMDGPSRLGRQVKTTDLLGNAFPLADAGGAGWVRTPLAMVVSHVARF